MGMFGGLLELVSERSAATHVAYPHGRSARFALPVSAGFGDRAVRFLTTRRGRTALAGQRVAGWFKQTPSPWLSAASTLREVAEFAGFDPALSTVSAGTPGPYNKPSVLFMTDGGEPVAIAKVAASEVNRALLRNEGAWLECWERAGVLTGHRPSKIKIGEAGGVLVLLQTVGLGPVLRLHAPLRQGHLEILSAVQSACAEPVPFLGSTMHTAMHRRFAACGDALDQVWRERLDRALAILEAGLAHADVPMVPVHRDFVPWNMRRTKSGLFVFDWEYASDGYMPLYDLYHYVLMPRAVRQSLSVADARRTIGEVRSVAIRLPDGAAKAQRAGLQLLAYLLNLCLDHLETNRGRNVGPARRRYGVLIDQYDQWKTP